MNKMTRALAITGAAVAAGLTVAAGPAAASPATTSTGSAAGAGAKTVATQQQDFKRRDRIVGFYNSPRTCHRIGKVGQWKNQWQRYTCFRVHRGFHSGDWALKAHYGWNYNQGNKHWNNGGKHYGGNQYPGGGHYQDGPGYYDNAPGSGAYRKN